MSECSEKGHAGQCDRCAVVPQMEEALEQMILAPPEHGTRALLVTIAKSLGIEISRDDGTIFRLALPADRREEFAAACRKELNHIQLRDTMALLTRSGAELTAADVFSVSPLTKTISLFESAELMRVLRDNRLTSVFHPIVKTDSPSEVFAYECLLRWFDDSGKMLPPGRIFGLARDAELIFNLDRAARVSALSQASAHGITTNIFINFVPTTIYRPEFCLRTTFAAVKEYNLNTEQIVFEVVESESINDVAHLNHILRYYRENGFRVALDDLGAGYSSLNLLNALRPDFVKLDMDLIRDIDKDPYKARVCRALLDLANDLGVPSIAEGVETVGEWECIKEFGATYIQGYLFAKPGIEPPVPVVPA